MSRTGEPSSMPDAPAVKQCCARLYESEAAKWLLGDSFHPGGLALTEKLGTELRLGPGDRVLDIACGQGTSALFLAERFGCELVGIDYSRESTLQASERAAVRGLNNRVCFREADAESLPFAAGAFDALICECAFCTFPDKARVARQFARVLERAGRLGLSDLTRSVQLAEQLEGLLAWIACIADAQPVARYVEQLKAAGFIVKTIAAHDQALRDLVRQVRGRLLAIELMSSWKKIGLPGLDLPEAQAMVRAAQTAIERRELGYALITAMKP